MDAAETAFAKINLALHVRRREADGYHAIETLFAFAEDGDMLRLVDEPGLRIVGPFAPALGEGDNLVLRAARGFADLTGLAVGGGFLLEKTLPVAAGIGGGSADAAAALRLLCAQAGIDPADPRVQALAGSLGADVPACLLSRPVRGEGRGDQLDPIDGIPAGQALLLVNPMRPLATGPVFAGWDGIDRGPLAVGDPMAAAHAGRNDLEPAAIAILPVIADVLGALRAQPGATLVRMSGSGATCFGLFESIASRDQAARRIRASEPVWWLLPTRLR
jgi:4-diphosphocytidyl-2-C-methyl-D-erythritol kinase